MSAYESWWPGDHPPNLSVTLRTRHSVRPPGGLAPGIARSDCWTAEGGCDRPQDYAAGLTGPPLTSHVRRIGCRLAETTRPHRQPAAGVPSQPSRGERPAKLYRSSGALRRAERGLCGVFCRSDTAVTGAGPRRSGR